MQTLELYMLRLLESREQFNICRHVLLDPGRLDSGTRDFERANRSIDPKENKLVRLLRFTRLHSFVQTRTGAGNWRWPRRRPSTPSSAARARRCRCPWPAPRTRSRRGPQARRATTRPSKTRLRRRGSGRRHARRGTRRPPSSRLDGSVRCMSNARSINVARALERCAFLCHGLRAQGVGGLQRTPVVFSSIASCAGPGPLRLGLGRPRAIYIYNVYTYLYIVNGTWVRQMAGGPGPHAYIPAAWPGGRIRIAIN